jgi:nucleotide-binding universal stress UspA family protein
MNTTMKQGSVVVGVDGSAGSGAALEWAVAHAQERRRPLLIANGAGDPRRSSQFVGLDDARQELRMEARRVTDRALGVVRRIAPDLDVEVTTPLHDARQALLDLAEKASIVVVGTRGLGPVKALLLGSVSAALAAHADCPVAVVRPAERDEEGRDPVVVGADGTEASTAALELAFELASVERRPLVVVHSWSTNDTFIDLASYQQRVDTVEEHTRMLAESLSGYQEKYPDVAVERSLPDASPLDTLVRLSETAALVVVGSRGRSGLRALGGSVSRAVVEHAHCTVVVARP